MKISLMAEHTERTELSVTSDKKPKVRDEKSHLVWISPFSLVLFIPFLMELNSTDNYNAMDLADESREIL